MAARSRIGAFLFALLASAEAFADCRCPRYAWSQKELIVVGEGLIACGYEDERRGDVVVASEFQVFRCGDENALLELGALQTALLRAKGSVLEIVEVERWPFGEKWQWVQVPVHEWQLDSKDPRPELRVIPPVAPKVSRSEIDAFVAEYEQWVAQGDARTYESAEELVERLFTSAVAGHPDAEALFLRMGDDVNLDGAAAEIHGQAAETFDEWRKVRRLSKH